MGGFTQGGFRMGAMFPGTEGIITAVGSGFRDPFGAVVIARLGDLMSPGSTLADVVARADSPAGRTLASINPGERVRVSGIITGGFTRPEVFAQVVTRVMPTPTAPPRTTTYEECVLRCLRGLLGTAGAARFVGTQCYEILLSLAGSGGLSAPLSASAGAALAAACVAGMVGVTVGSVLNCFIQCSPVVGPGRPITPQEIEEELRRRELARQQAAAAARRRADDDDDDDDDDEDDDDNNNNNNGNPNGNWHNSRFGVVANASPMNTMLAAGTVRMAMQISQAAAARGIRITPAQVIQLLAQRQQAGRPFGTL